MTASSPDNRHVKKQIDKIIDEASDEKVSVIVQMKTDEELSQYLALTTEAIDRRRVVTSARMLVPPAKKELRVSAQGRLTPAAKKNLELSDSLPAIAFLATQALGLAPYASLVQAGTKALTPLLQSLFVNNMVVKAQEKSGSTKKKSVPVHFSLSGSAVLELTKDELHKLPDNVANVADVFVNRPVRIPPVAKSAELPRVVEDNKANTWGLAQTGALASWEHLTLAARVRLLRCSIPVLTLLIPTSRGKSLTSPSSMPMAESSPISDWLMRTTAINMALIAPASLQAATRAADGSAWRRKQRSWPD